MQSNTLAQVENSDKNTKIKCPEGDKLFLGCGDTTVQEFSMTEMKIIHQKKILNDTITSMAKTSDNKS